MSDQNEPYKKAQTWQTNLKKDGFLKFKIKFINPILYIHFFFYNLIEPASDWVNQIPYIQKLNIDLPGKFSAITFTPQIVNTQKLYLIWFAIRDFVHRKNLLKQIKKSYTISQLYFDTRNQPPPPPLDIRYEEKSVDHLPASGAAK